MTPKSQKGWPDEQEHPLDADDNTPLEFDDDFWDAFSTDDEAEIEPLPEPGDIWVEPNEDSLFLSP
ncbi:MAG: hypothetical protein MI725_03355, partial [Pirellulales bacterium]|nr:hypothetical protein [Pirellulales bacterium]